MSYEETLQAYATTHGWSTATTQRLLLQFIQQVTSQPTAASLEDYLMETVAKEQRPELVTAVMQMINAKLKLWEISWEVERLIGFIVETDDEDCKLNQLCGDRDPAAKVTAETALELIAELIKEEQ